MAFRALSTGQRIEFSLQGAALEARQGREGGPAQVIDIQIPERFRVIGYRCQSMAQDKLQLAQLMILQCRGLPPLRSFKLEGGSQ